MKYTKGAPKKSDLIEGQLIFVAYLCANGNFMKMACRVNDSKNIINIKSGKLLNPASIYGWVTDGFIEVKKTENLKGTPTNSDLKQGDLFWGVVFLTDSPQAQQVLLKYNTSLDSFLICTNEKLEVMKTSVRFWTKYDIGSDAPAVPAGTRFK